MKQHWLIVAILGVSILTLAQQPPKVINAQFQLSPPAQDCPRRWTDFSIRMDHSGWVIRWRLLPDRIFLCVRATPSHPWTMDVAVSID
jgi:hypothetical protein